MAAVCPPSMHCAAAHHHRKPRVRPPALTHAAVAPLGGSLDRFSRAAAGIGGFLSPKSFHTATWSQWHDPKYRTLGLLGSIIFAERREAPVVGFPRGVHHRVPAEAVVITFDQLVVEIKSVLLLASQKLQQKAVYLFCTERHE